MSNSCNAETLQLFSASPKEAARLFREEIRAHCTLSGCNYLDIEQTFQKVRGSLAHLCNHMTFEGPLDAKIKEIIKLARELTRHPDSSNVYSVRRLAKIEQSTDSLEDTFRRIQRGTQQVTLEEVEIFIALADRLRERYLQERFDSSDAIDPTHYAQAHMIAANFETYNRTLNEC